MNSEMIRKYNKSLILRRKCSSQDKTKASQNAALSQIPFQGKALASVL